MRPGIKVSDIYHLLINSIHGQGFISPFRPGHSIGLDVLDFWSIVESNPYILKPGMIIAIHPSVMLEKGGDACGMGYTYLITDTGAEKLSKVDLGCGAFEIGFSSMSTTKAGTCTVGSRLALGMVYFYRLRTRGPH